MNPNQERIDELVALRQDIAFLLIEANSDDVEELQLELKEIEREIEALGGELNEYNEEEEF
jgi:hypothetical protein